MWRPGASAWVLVGWIACAQYLPGVAPTDYEEEDEVELRVNKLTSTKTQLPHDYYYAPFCKPDVVKPQPLNLGEVLMGETIYNSAFNIKMNVPQKCQLLCAPKALTEADVKVLTSLIQEEYVVNWLVDNLPVTTRYSSATGSVTYLNGFPVGYTTGDTFYLHNHFAVSIFYHRVDSEIVDSDDKEDIFRVVGFEVEPFSVQQPELGETGMRECPGLDGSPQPISAGATVAYTFDVEFRESQLKWASRWDAYLKMGDGHVHWFSIINSLTIVVFLSGMVAMILLRTLHRDITKYNELNDDTEETGWKLVHGDVFRPPPLPRLYAILLGSGVQIGCMALLVIVFAAAGFLSPAYRGGLVQAMVVTFMLLGSTAGYVSARVTKLFGRRDWKATTFLAGTLYTGFVSALFFGLDLVLWGQASAGAVPFTTMLLLMALWFCVSLPLCFVGAYFGLKAPAIEVPVRTNVIERQVPEQPWFMNPLFSAMISGVLPFGAVFTELYFIMLSIWQHRFYYLFGFLVLVFIILVVACSEIAIAYTYFQLLCEDYRWWWRSYWGPAFSGVYVFLYAILYFVKKLELTYFASKMLYFGYMLFVSVSFTLLTGAIGSIASFVFVRAIFSSIKID